MTKNSTAHLKNRALAPFRKLKKKKNPVISLLAHEKLLTNDLSTPLKKKVTSMQPHAELPLQIDL